MRVNVLYFARLREALGLSQETLELPEGVCDIAGLMAWLAARGEAWQQEFAGCRPLRAALNQSLVTQSAGLAEGDEVAFFPPVTGG
ncbi:MAG: molybdopterin converting factor subunit 1 [Methylobacterium sp.]|nr:molybdopterin converting factor subunit 1 [Methylobacterium sp.]